MKITVSRVCVAASGALALALSLSTPASAAPAANPAPITNTPWSGYTTNFTIAPHAFYDVGALWRVPYNKCGDTIFDVPDASQWVGLAGLGSPVIQLGVESHCLVGLQINLPFWEIYPPNSGNQFFRKINAGDLMIASEEYLGSGRYSLSLGDISTDWSWSKTISGPNSVPTTADWIVEAGAQPFGGETALANFGSVTFTDCSYSTATVHGAFLDSGISPLTFETEGPNGLLTNVSPISSGGTFTVTYVGP
jgi:hypothetical protein